MTALPSSENNLIPLPSMAEVERLENELFALREQCEVLWLRMGQILSRIIDEKLYRLRRDDDGTYFRTATAYVKWLDKQFTEKGWGMSRSTLYRWMRDYRLFVEELGLSEDEALLLGKSNLDALGQGVRRLRQEGNTEAAQQLVADVVEAAKVTGGLPTAEVRAFVDDDTGRVMKGMSADFDKTEMGTYRLSRLTLWWNHTPTNLFDEAMSPAQVEWLCRRLGLQPPN